MNTENQEVKIQSRFKGVSWSKNAKRWQVVINLGKNPETGKQISKGLGNFTDESVAAMVYNEYVNQNNLNKKLNDIE